MNMLRICCILLGIGMVCHTYTFKCPVVSHWNLIAAETCESVDKYVCLENVLKGTYQQGCSGIDYSRPGSKLVFQPFFNRAPCFSHRYQPFSFSTFKNTFCVLKKSLCEEEGQVTFISDYTDEDTTCRCDYTRGYVFVTQPSNKCFCVPSMEDCTCFKPRCATVSQDYECSNSSSRNSVFECPKVINGNDDSSETGTKITPLKPDIRITRSYIDLSIYSIIAFTGTSVAFCVVFLKHVKKRVIERHDASMTGPPCSYLHEDDTEETTLKQSVTIHSEDGVVKEHASLSSDEDNGIENKCKSDETFERSHLISLIVIGKRGVGKRSLIRRLLGQHGENMNDRHKLKTTCVCKVSNTNGIWTFKEGKENISGPSILDTVMTVSDIRIPDEVMKLTVDSYGEEFHNCTQGGSQKSIQYKCSAEKSNVVELASNVIVLRQESVTKSIGSDTKGHNAPDYGEKDVCLHPELERETSKQNEQESNKITVSSISNEETDLDYRLCHVLEVERQIDFLLIHRLISPCNAVFVLVIDGTNPPWKNVNGSRQFYLDWLKTLYFFHSNKYNAESTPHMLIVFTKMDQLQVSGVEEHYEYKLIRMVPTYMKHFIGSIHFISNLIIIDCKLDKIRDKIFAKKTAVVKVDKSLQLQVLRKHFDQMLMNGVYILNTTDLKKKEKLFYSNVTDEGTDEQLKLCLNYCHNLHQVVYFDESSLSDKIIINPFWIVKAFRYIVTDDVDDSIASSECWNRFRATGEISNNLLNQLLRQSHDTLLVEHTFNIVETFKKLGIILHINNSHKLFMPTMMKVVSPKEVYKKLVFRDFYKTPWLCLEFSYLPPAIFNHILAWYTRTYKVWEVRSEIAKKCAEMYALYRNLGVFILSESKQRYLVVYGAEHIIALQIYEGSSQYIIQNNYVIREKLVAYIKELLKSFQIRMDLKFSYKCDAGDVTQDRVYLESIPGKTYRCKEHYIPHMTGDIIGSWCKEDSKAAEQYVSFKRLLDTATDAVRVAFDNEIQPEKLSAVLRSNRSMITKLIIGRHIEQKNKVKVLPQTGQVMSSETFDIKLMNCLLRNLIELEIRTSDKNVPLDDIKLRFESSCSTNPFRSDKERCLSIVNLYRIHLPKFRMTSLSDTRFQEYCSHLKDAIVRLGGEKLKNNARRFHDCNTFSCTNRLTS